MHEADEGEPYHEDFEGGMGVPHLDTRFFGFCKTLYDKFE